MSQYTVLYIGSPEDRLLSNMMLTLHDNVFYNYNPSTRQAQLQSVTVNKRLMKRYYLMERAKDAGIVGLVIGTLGVSNYLQMHNRLRKLIANAGKQLFFFPRQVIQID